MSGTGKINDFVPIGTSLVGEVTFITKEMAKALNTQREIMERLQERNEKLEKMAFQYTTEEWNTMLRTIERLQEQLKEANEVMKKYKTLEMGLRNNKGTLESVCPAWDYLKKWGVK